ncbi:MAG: hypothetical protein K1X89_29730 [Myxococcaceae bacterium]|nr:hypothetical protein [Myxococcaceae bacterium]
MASSNDQQPPKKNPLLTREPEKKGWGLAKSKGTPSSTAPEMPKPRPANGGTGWAKGTAPPKPAAAAAPAAPETTKTGKPPVQAWTQSAVAAPAAGPALGGPGAPATTGEKKIPVGLPKQFAAPPLPGNAMAAARHLTDHQKGQLNSAFNDGERELRAQNMIGNTREGGTGQDVPSTSETYDGVDPAPEVTSTDIVVSLQPPVQSREGRRSGALLRNVIHQFGVANNPRYEADGRGHIFVWDVSKAMHCEIPHFMGMRELTLGQTVDWIRLEGPMRGWTRTSLEGALEAAQGGHLVIALPKDIKVKQLAVVLPEKTLAPDLKPFVAAAGPRKGSKLKLSEALGVFAAEYFAHA